MERDGTGWIGPAKAGGLALVGLTDSLAFQGQRLVCFPSNVHVGPTLGSALTWSTALQAVPTTSSTRISGCIPGPPPGSGGRGLASRMRSLRHLRGGEVGEVGQVGEEDERGG